MARSRKFESDTSQENRLGTSLSTKLVALEHPGGVAAEAYRMLRTNLLYAQVDVPRTVIVLTSPGPTEGKSITTANLGVMLAKADKNTLILDCDLRKPKLHDFFGTGNVEGLVDIMIGERTLQEVQQEPMPGLQLVTAGPPSPIPAELLSSRRLAEFLKQVRQEFDYVLVDTPPVGWASDAAILATNGDGVLLVLDSQRTSRRSLKKAFHTLQNVGANVMGTVINNAEVSIDDYYKIHYGP